MSSAGVGLEEWSFDADDKIAWSGGAPTDPIMTHGEGVTVLDTCTGWAATLASAEVPLRCTLDESDYAAPQEHADANDMELVETRATVDDE